MVSTPTSSSAQAVRRKSAGVSKEPSAKITDATEVSSITRVRSRMLPRIGSPVFVSA